MDEFNNDEIMQETSSEETTGNMSETVNETVYETGENAYVGMSDEEIRLAADNIGSTPYTEPQNNEDPYASYTSYNYGSTEENYSGRSNETYDIPRAKKKKNIFGKIMKFVGMAACFGIVAGGTFFGSVKALDHFLGEDSFLSSTAAAEATAEIKQMSLSNLLIASADTATEGTSDNNVVVDVVKKNMSCTVSVNCKVLTTTTDFWGRRYQYETDCTGSGFIVGKNDTQLLVATNYHVVEGATSVKIKFSDDNEIDAAVLDKDADNDLAIVAVNLENISKETFDTITIAKLGSSDDAEVGEMVIAIGNALGYGQSVTVGYLSAKDREITSESGTKMKLLQTDAAINSGNSGGPLFNTRGEVIGINCAKLADTSVEGMCFAIPISAAIPILDELMAHVDIPEEEQGWLGISMSAYSPELMGMPAGIYVVSAVEGGPAEKAGILSGDIITAVNGKQVSSSDALSEAIHSHKVGEEITVTLKRQESGKWKEMEVKAVLVSNPNK